MASARDDVLARIRSALGDARGVAVEVPRDYRRDDAPADLDLLEERIADYRATVQRVPASGVAGAVAAAFAARGVRRVVAPAGLPGEWLAQVDGGGAGGVGDGGADGADDGVVEVVVDVGTLTTDDLDGFDGVVTTCAVAIAQTGTLVLDGSAGQGRRAITLVPDYHLCVVPADRAVPDVPAAVDRLDPTRPLTWISGPSATSDIELNRVEGVHGPRTLDVIVVE